MSLTFVRHIQSANEQMKFQLYFKSATHQPMRASGEIAFLISKQFGTLPTKVVSLSFDKTCAVQGTVVLELALTAGETMASPRFQKKGMDISQLTNAGPSSDSGSRPKLTGSRAKVPRSKAAGNSKGGFMFWKSSAKRGGRKFGVKMDPNCEDIPEIMLQIIPCLEENGLNLFVSFRVP